MNIERPKRRDGRPKGMIVSTFAPNGMLLASAQIGEFFDIGALGSLAPIPSSGVLLHLLSDGRLFAIHSENLAVSLVMDVRTLSVDASAIYDVLDAAGPLIIPRRSSVDQCAICAIL